MAPRTDPRLLRQFGAGARARREKLDLSQEVIGQRAGLNRTYITKVEGGHNNVTLGVIMRLAHALGVTPSELLAGVEDGVDPTPDRPQ